MIKTIEDLGHALVKKQDEANNTYIASDGVLYFVDDEDLSVAASELLMTWQWRPDWTVIKKFETLFTDFKVSKGEGDASGWLTGVIVTPKAKFVFG